MNNDKFIEFIESIGFVKYLNADVHSDYIYKNHEIFIFRRTKISNIFGVIDDYDELEKMYKKEIRNFKIKKILKK